MTNSTYLPYYVAGTLAALTFLAIWVKRVAIPSLKRARTYALAMQECGHLGDPPSDRAFAIMSRFTSFFVRHFVGEIRQVGHEKLATLPGPFLLAFNHGSLLDTAIAPVVLNRKARYPAAQGVMKAFGGLVALVFGRWGVFAVDLDNGAAALEASVKVMTQGEIEVIFPEAWTNMDGVVGKFKTGTVRIARAAAAKLGKPVYIVPGYMRYGRYPGKWITRLPIPVQWLIPMLFAFYYGRGVTVVIGEPISSDELPVDHHAGTEKLRQAIISLDPGCGCN